MLQYRLHSRLDKQVSFTSLQEPLHEIPPIKLAFRCVYVMYSDIPGSVVSVKILHVNPLEKRQIYVSLCTSLAVYSVFNVSII